MSTKTMGAGRGRAADLLLQLINTAPELTRTDLVERSGLSSSTVAQVVSRLVDDGLVAETVRGKGPGTGSGRPARTLSIVPQGTVVGAVDFGHRRVRVALGDDAGQVLGEVKLHIDVDLRAREAMELAGRYLHQLVKDLAVKHPSLVVAGIPGPLDGETGQVCSPTILSSWVGLEPKRELESYLGTTVHVENDAVLGAWGELHGREGRALEDFVYIKVSNGVGAAMVMRGEVYRGSRGLAGEIGHTRLSGHNELCRCGGRGCLETVVTLSAVTEELRYTHPQLDPQHIRLAELTDPTAHRILEESGRTLGVVLAPLCNLLNPAAVVLGGELGASGEPFVRGVRASVHRFALPGSSAEVELAASVWGERAELMGALVMAGQMARV